MTERVPSSQFNLEIVGISPPQPLTSIMDEYTPTELPSIHKQEHYEPNPYPIQNILPAPIYQQPISEAVGVVEIH